MSRILEVTGLDWFVVLTGQPAFEDAALPYPSTLAEIRDKLDIVDDKDKLDDAVEFCQDLLDREMERADRIEAKAFTLLGITGIGTAFITGFAALLLDRGKIASTPALITAAILFILAAVSFLWTISLATRVVAIGRYRFTRPSANDVFLLSSASLLTVKHERAVSLFHSFAQNVRQVDRKATYLGGAQLWFRNSITLLLILTFFLTLYLVVRTLAPAPGMPASPPPPAPATASQPTQAGKGTPTSFRTTISTATQPPAPAPTLTALPRATHPLTATAQATVTP